MEKSKLGFQKTRTSTQIPSKKPLRPPQKIQKKTFIAALLVSPGARDGAKCLKQAWGKGCGTRAYLRRLSVVDMNMFVLHSSQKLHETGIFAYIGVDFRGLSGAANKSPMECLEILSLSYSFMMSLPSKESSERHRGTWTIINTWSLSRGLRDGRCDGTCEAATAARDLDGRKRNRLEEKEQEKVYWNEMEWTRSY